jgi:hypothetical protein
MSETQNVETTNTRNISSRNSFAEPQTAPATIPEPAAPVETSVETAPEVSGEPNEPASEGELPEYAKRRLGRERKKFEREINSLRTELDEERKQRTQQSPPQSYQSVYADPIVPNYQIDLNTPEGRAINDYQMQLSSTLQAQEQKEKERQQKEIDTKLYHHFVESFDDAREKHTDFDTVIRTSGMSGPIAAELAQFPDPGELGYYIASNPREVDRLQRLPAYEMRRELARHMGEMAAKVNITRAPTPVKPIMGGAGTPAKSFAHKTLAELKADRAAELRGKRSR